MKRVRCLVRVGAEGGGVHEVGEVVAMKDRLADAHVAAGNAAHVDEPKPVEAAPSEPVDTARHKRGAR